MLERLKIFSFLILALCFFSSSVHAQSIPGISDPIQVKVAPETPKPNSSVTVTIQSFSIDLDKALIVWVENGKEINKGVGLKIFNTTAGPNGSTKRIDISATIPGTGTFKQTVVLKPADISLVWEADSYTPPFYKGKALRSYNGAYRVIAVPEFIGDNGKRIDPHDLVYTWKRNGEVQGDASGYGKTFFVSSQTSYLRQGEDISVTVSAPKDNVAGSANITITPVVPKMLFYEKSPLYGIQYEKSLGGSTKLTNEEITVVGEPYFFSVRTNTSPSLAYTWKLNGNILDGFVNKPTVTLRKTGGQGVANLNVVVQHQTNLLQGANKDLYISYE